MGAFDDLIPQSQGGAFDDLIPTTDTEKKKGASGSDYLNALDSAIGQGVAGIGASAGTFLQDPGAALVSGALGARALADRGVRWAINKAAPDAVPEVNEDFQRAAQDASQWAQERRDENLARGDITARVGKFMEDDSRRVVREIQERDRAENPELVRQQQAMGEAEGFVGNVKAAIDNPLALTHTLARSVPDMAAGLGAAATVARAGLGMRAVSGAGIASESASSAMHSREGVYQAVATMPLDKLANSPRFNEIAQQTGDPAKAREILANELADQAPMLAGLATSLGSAVTNRLFGGDATAQSVAALAGREVERITPKVFGKRVAQDTVEEGAQGVPEDSVQHGAEVQADPSKRYDPAGSLAQNMVAGLAMGSGGHGLAYTRQAYGDLKEKLGQGGETKPPAGETQPPSSATPAQVSEAEQALREPVTLTALDRVGEIQAEDQRLAARQAELSAPDGGYGPMFDTERQELADKRAALAAERDNITRTWPKAEPGQQTSFTTEAGVRLDAQYALMEASDLVTSHDENLRQNTAYPQELQPRARDRAASEMQISGIVQKLDPARLGLSADAANGAPIVGADGLVESGNARTIALKRVYQANGQKAADYKQFLRDNAVQFGLTPERIDAMDRPVLVRVRTTPVNRAEFARQANASTVAAMSPSEQAKADAARIDSMEDLSPDDQGDFQTSREFIRRFMARLPVTEQAGMVDSTGRLSAAGYARVRNAVLAKAYGDSPVLMRLVESLDDSLRNVSKALMTAAPKVAQMREAVAQGARFDADITPDLMAAVEELSRIKEAGKSVADVLAQAGMFGEQFSQETRDLLQFLADNIRRPRRIADFIVGYMDALDTAGDPNQGSLLGDVQAPAKRDLMTAAKASIEGNANADQDAQRGDAGKDEGPGAQDRGQPADAARDQGGAQGDEAAGRAGAADGEWVAFPPESGTLGIPRRDMPQIKGEQRGALIQFLKARGIEHENDTVLASTLKPTQAEYSRAKVDKFVENGLTGTRSVLVSADGHVLDGHHQWLGHAERGEEIPVIRLDAPMRDLLPVVEQFPGVKRSDGAADIRQLRSAAVQDFKDALADLAEIASKHTRAAMMPEDTPGLRETLVKLFDAAFRIVGTDMRAASRWVRDQLRKDPATKKIANFIKTSTMEDAAREALAKAEKAGLQGGLFDDLQEASDAVQGDLFGAQPAAPAATKVAMIDGRPYDMKRDNYTAKPASDFVSAGLLDVANQLIDKFFKGKQPNVISDEARAKAEAALKPMLARAQDDKAVFDQSIIDIAREVGIGQMIAPLKSIGRAAEKVVIDYEGDASKIADLLRATIIVERYEDAGKVLSALVSKYGQDSISKIKNKTGIALEGIDAATLAKVKDQDRAGFGGYADVSLIVKTPSGVLAEVQINVPAMMAVKDAEGHKLYEAARQQPKDSEREREIDGVMKQVYDEAFASAVSNAASLKNSASVRGNHSLTGPRGPMAVRGSSERPSSDNANQSPDGNSTKNPPSVRSTNRQPSGNDSGTLISSPLDQSVSQVPVNGYTDGKQPGVNDANVQPGARSAQGKGAGAAQEPGRQRAAARVRAGSGGADLFGNLDEGAGDRAGAGVRQSDEVRPDEGGRGDELGAGTRARAGTGRNAGVPAGRDIPAKTGRNYEFGPDDLTYQGSWFKKAEQNVAAVELLKTLEKEGRQATREEQAVLAKFIGWGSSEIANNLFGKKLDQAAEALREYDAAVQAMDSLKRDYLNKGGQYRGHYADNGYYQAVGVLRAAGKITGYQMPDRITRAELDAAKPDGSTRRWLELRARLRAALSEQELAEASRSTQYAHYTSKAVVQSMWKAMERMGFNGGSILEPGAGIGVFPGLMPAAMANNSIYTGVEFDSITGGVLKQLFPDERILVESFVDSKLPKNFYDVAIGNPPFSGTKILSDPEYAKRALSLHDYFFAKSIDRVKPGGLVVYVTSRYTMDKLDDKARAYLAERADLVGAIRLPQTAFKQNAGTEVVTDVIFLRKKVPGEKFEGAQAWAKSGEIKGEDGKPLMVKDQHGTSKPAMVNEYFVAHPEMVLGTHANTGSMYSDQEYTVMPLEGDIEAHFAKAVENLPQGIYHAERGSSAEAAQVREIDFNPRAKKEGNYYVTDAGVLMVREGGVGQRVQLRSAKDEQLVKDFVPLRDALKQAHYDQLNDGPWEQSLKALQEAYAAFTKKHGQINQFTTKTVKTKAVDEETGETYTDEAQVRVFTLDSKLNDDPDWTLVQALEVVNEDTGEIRPSAFLTDRVLGKQEGGKLATPADALLSSLNDVGHVDIGLIASRLGLTEADVIESLGTAIYEDPESGWQTADQYLSGNVKRKLDAAREAAKADKRYERNVTALEAVQPAPKNPSQINIGLGMNWVPGEVYAQFLRELSGVTAHVEWNERTRQWIVQEKSGGATMAAKADWGTGDRNVTELLEHALTGRPVRITKSVGTGSDRKTFFDAAGTEAANQKLEQLKERFGAWVWEDAERTDRLVRLYNDTFNTTVPRSFDGTHLTLPGTSKAFSVFDHVKRGAWRIIQSGNTYLAHAVGSGKTFQMVISAMEQKRLGLIKKPMVVVPNHMLKQFAHEWQMLYPAARLMVADENNFHTDNRRRFVSRVALSDLDGVIITHSAFKLLDLDPEFKKQIIEEQLEFMRASLEEAEDAEGKGGRKSPRIKQIEKQIENLEQKLEASLSSAGKDTNVRFDELGVDFLYVDEAHEFRKLDFSTSRQVKGISPQGSARALDLYIKARYLDEKNPGRSLVLASGTPVTNTLAELYTVQKFMGRQAMIDKGIEDFDSWAAMFGRERTVLEPNAAGKYEPVTRFSKFVNVPELTQMFREFADVLTSDHLAALLGDKRPRVDGGSRKIIVTPKTEAYAEFQAELSARVEQSRAWKPSKDEPNNPDPMIRIIGDGRLAAIDMRFINPSLPSDPDSKLNRMIDDVIRALKESADMEFVGKDGKVEPNKGASMMVFSDLGFGAGVAENRGFNARAWFEKRLRDAGIPAGQIAFMSDYKKSSEKLKLFKDVNAGRVRLLVGSSKNMGTGVNAQQRLLYEFHLDSPWYPADLEQREGRIIRQGNKNPLVRIFAYAAKGTYDENMWKMLASKQFFIDQALSGDENLRELEDLDSQSQYDLAAAMVAEDPRILQLAGAKAEIEKLQRLYRAHEDQRARFKQQHDSARMTVSFNEKRLPEAERLAGQAQDLSGDKFRAKVMGKTYTDRAEWAEALLAKYKELTAKAEPKPLTIGEISGFPLVYGAETVAGQFTTKVMMATAQPLELVYDAGASPIGVAMRAQNAVADVARMPAKMRERITEAQAQIDALATRLEAPFPMAGMLADKIKEAAEIEAAIAADGKPRTWRVERADSGLGFDVEATSADEAITKAIATNGGTPEEWTAVEAPKDKPAATALSRGAGGGMDLADLQALAARIKAKMPNMPAVVVLPDPSKAPRALREYIIRQDAWDDVDGAMHEGKLYLFASGLSDPLRAEHVLAEHEAAHWGLRAVLGDSLKTAMNLIYAQNPQVRKAALELQRRGKLTNAEAVEEVIVDLPSAQLASLKGWRKVVALVRDWMGEHGFDRIAQKLTDWLDGSVTDQERADLFVAELVRGARDYVAGKQGIRKGASLTGTRLATSLADDIAKQEKWLAAEAKARGYKDIEDLLEKNYPLFEKLAALWREKNPADGGVMLSRAPAVESDAFKRWFGDSEVVDAQGKPLVMYHGSRGGDIDQFRPATYFTEAQDEAGGYARAGAVYPVYLSIQKPYEASDDQDAENRSELTEIDDAYAAELEAKGFDGVVARRNGETLWAIPFRPEQIKSAIGNRGTFDPTDPDIRLSRASKPTAAERAEQILAKKAGAFAPIDALAKGLTRITGVERLTGAIYRRAAYLLDRYTPEQIKAGVVADYGVPEAVIDQRAMMQGRQRVQLRKAGALIEKLSTLTRAESRVAYAWMNETDAKAADRLMQDLPPESVKVLKEVQQMIDKLSQEAVAMGQLSQDAFERNRFAYLRRSYAKHVIEQTAGEKAKRARVISILGDQYKGRGLTEAAPMDKIKATDWWKRKEVKGKADAALKGEKFIRLERRAPAGDGTEPLPGMDGKQLGRLLEVAWWPAGEAVPTKYAGWHREGTWEVRDVQGAKAVMWRDFTKEERQTMGEVDEARFAIAKTLHGMIHDVEVGRYLEWVAQRYGKKEGETIPGKVVEASERYRDTFAPGEWVKVPDTKIHGTTVAKYGKLAGQYIPGPVWNDLRQVIGGQFKPLGETYAKILTMWKTAKTALSPAVHMNNVMANMVMADWHDVRSAHVAKALRLVLAASQRDGRGVIGRAGNLVARAGIADREAAREILNRYKDSGGDIGSWATNEIARDQLEPLLDTLEKELAATAGQSTEAQVGVMAALQHALMLRFPSAWEAAKGSKPGKMVGTEAKSLIDLYQAEDDVFRLAAWLKAKEDGKGDLEAGKASRKSFLDYHINAPWIQAMRSTGWPFISFTYRAVPMMLEVAGKKPHKLLKLMALAGSLNALGVMLAGGGDDERKLLPEEKAGKIWGMVPKLIRMPWNDMNGHPVYLDIRRFIPVGDVFDTAQGHSAIPVLPGLQPGGPLALFAEIIANRSMFTGKPITLDTDTPAQKAAKVGDYLYKAFAPNILGLPGTYATTGVLEAAQGKTDAFGREQSVAQAVASSFGVKLGSYPADVMRLNLNRKAQAELMEIDRNIAQLKRQRMTNRISQQEFEEAARVEQDKQRKVLEGLRAKVGG